MNLSPDCHVTVVSGSNTGSASLEPGDVVEVCEGDLMHLQATVVSIDGENVTVLPKHEDLHVSSSQRCLLVTFVVYL